MNWQNIDVDSRKESESISQMETQHNNDSIHHQNEQKRLVQQEKFANQKHNKQKRSYIDAVSKFGELLMNNKAEEIANDLMAEDCGVTLINFAEISPLEHKMDYLGFISLLNDYKVTKREVKETYIDLEKTTVIQICFCKIVNQKEDVSIMQFSFEIISFKDQKIKQYKASFGSMAESNDPESLFVPSNKEKMLAKVKELNYAWVDQPNLQKIASLLHEKTEYKLWTWRDNKCLILNKDNFASEFRKSIEENFVIKSIVPFDPSFEGQLIIGSYVYYLEGKGELEGRKYQWINTCIYAFDLDLNIAKINQQGELYPEDEVLIPFEINNQEKIQERVDAFYTMAEKSNFSLFGNSDFNFSFEIVVFGRSKSQAAGVIKGFSEYKKLMEVKSLKSGNFELVTPIDLYLDLNSSIYDTAISVDHIRGLLDRKGKPEHGKRINIFTMRKFSFENGKIAKIIMFAFGALEYDSSRPDHINSSGLNVENDTKLE